MTSAALLQSAAARLCARSSLSFRFRSFRCFSHSRNHSRYSGVVTSTSTIGPSRNNRGEPPLTVRASLPIPQLLKERALTRNLPLVQLPAMPPVPRIERPRRNQLIQRNRRPASTRALPTMAIHFPVGSVACRFCPLCNPKIIDFQNEYVGGDDFCSEFLDEILHLEERMAINTYALPIQQLPSTRVYVGNHVKARQHHFTQQETWVPPA